MIGELGLFALVLALVLALMQAALPLAGAHRGQRQWMAVARPAAVGQLLMLALSLAALATAFLQNDFSLAYVAENSNTALPWYYRLTAVWGAHEGSLLLWAVVLGSWSVAVAAWSRQLPEIFVARVLGVMGLVSVGFLAFTLLTSNPFERLTPVPAEGRDLNPLLQDPGMIAHPPMLYMGYVGFSVAFAFAIAALLGGRLDAAWARWSRPWTTAAWVFLTLGISIGSWWAYYELGWGGWWFWDPVENASFMPWLTGTALIHSLSVTEKRGAFRGWTVLLAIVTFSLSLLGTFLVRSGVLTSVHSFATDPARGAFILGLLILVVGGSLVLYAWRAPRLAAGGSFGLVSREMALLLNNALLCVAAATVLIGTLYPLALDAFGLGKVSVGPPYFEAVFVPLMLPLLAMMGIGSLVRWKRHAAGPLARTLLPAATATLCAGLASLWWLGEVPPLAALGLALSVWIAWTSVQAVADRVRGRRRRWQALRTTPRSVWGMALAHFGLAVFAAGVTVVSTLDLERDVRLAPGESIEAAGYTWTLQSVRSTEGPNYSAERGEITVNRDGRTVATLYPEERVYRMQSNPMTEAGINAGLFRDFYVALGERRADGSWTVRIQLKPLVRWIWLGTLFMALGGGLAITDPRYRRLTERARLGAEAPA
ncbi:heme lyase CcmF/NrfE family subunit [Aquisalimonas lutea]|uniref:heme lyase CcmF/NrfE family subunit n=1 Tax=Aquisalimonas lutea TaxID=1327750 RepID=UPI0025B369C8|nr:heme lyase CcmF/NrfE family subunit [Aquisalimonas lutea]MDN3519080.1 heme lyase CcmF/NrfE family subunit [Aquisalimonas lutea]